MITSAWSFNCTIFDFLEAFDVNKRRYLFVVLVLNLFWRPQKVSDSYDPMGI